MPSRLDELELVPVSRPLPEDDDAGLREAIREELGTLRRAAVAVASHLRPTIASVAANYTITDDDSLVLADATTAPVTVTLPSAADSEGLEFTVKRTNSGANAVTISRAGTDLIEGATTITLSAQWAYRTLRSDGLSTWYVVATG